MTFIVEDSFKRNISDNDLKILNRLLTTKALDIYDKKNAFLIASFLNGTVHINEEEVSILDYFKDFCLNERINKKNIFSSLVFNICEKINQTLKKDITEQLGLKAKILTISLVGTNILELSDKDYNDILIKILNSNIHSGNCGFIIKLFENTVLKKEVEKLKIVFYKFLTSNSNNLIQSNLDYDNILAVLTDKDILKLDNNSYSKIVDTVLSEKKIYYDILISTIKNPNLTPDKKIKVIEYHQYMIKKYSKKYSITNPEWFLEQKEGNVFNVLISNNLLMMADKEYSETLKRMMTSNVSSSYAKVLADEHITEEKRLIALSLLDKSKVKDREYNIKKDYKDDVATAAISPVLINYQAKDYINILALIDYLCETLEEVCNSGKIDSRIVCGAISRGIVKILNRSNLYKNNITRFYEIINMLLITNPKEKLIDMLVEFCCHKNSIYYTDYDFFRVLELIKKSDSLGLTTEIIDLFTNANIPYLEDKGVLFETAKTENKELIRKITFNLNVEGNYNNNINCILEGADDEVVNHVIGPNILKTRTPRRQ